MTARVVFASAAMLACGALVGCGGDSGGSGSSGDADKAPADCTAVAPARLNEIANGLTGNTGTVDAGEAVALPAELQEFGFTDVAAVTVNGGSEPVLVMMQGLDDGGGISVVDSGGARVFDWGTAAQSGSPMGDYQAQVAKSSAAKDAKDCLN